MVDSLYHVLATTPHAARREPHMLRAVILEAETAAFGTPGSNFPFRGASMLVSRMEAGLNLEWTYWLNHKIGDWLSLDGGYDTALMFARQSCEAAEEAENEAWLWKGRKLQADILLRAGRPHEALYILPIEMRTFFLDGYFHLLSWAETLLAIGEKTSAEAHIGSAIAVARDYELDDGSAQMLAQRL